MILHNLHILNADRNLNTIHVRDGLIKSLSVRNAETTGESNEPSICFQHAMAFPGLINSHDHLDFNLFPRLGNRIYNNYAEWGEDILQTDKQMIDKVLKIPLQLRIEWGIFKNALNGITTVVNHGVPLEISNDIITVYQECNSLHSTRFEKNWRYKLNGRFKNKDTVVIHIGEGTDMFAKKEVDRLIRWNLFKKKIIGVHGISMTARQASAFHALVWCPASNHFLFRKTAKVDKLLPATPILFGTDSTLTGEWNLWNHLRLAREDKLVRDEELFNMVTQTPSEVWGLKNSGRINEGFIADLVVARIKDESNPMDSFFSLFPGDILLVMHKGNIVIFDEEISNQMMGFKNSANLFSKININNRGKYVRGNLPALMDNIRGFYPEVNFPISKDPL